MSVNNAFLVKPNIIYQTTFIAAIKELQKSKNTTNYLESNLDLQKLANKQYFADYLNSLAKQAVGADLKLGWVAHTTYWFIKHQSDNKLVWLGRVNIRHRLTEHLRKIGGHIGYVIRPSMRRQGYGNRLLALALDKVRVGRPQLDTDRVLLTCDETNLGSKKIIENNGGIFANYAEQTPPLPRKLRYWISLT